MPWGDWQFWIVTLAALGAVLWLIRMLYPKKKRSVRADLTVHGEKPARR